MDSAGIGKGVLIATLGTVAGGIVLQHLGYLSMVVHWIAEAFVWLWHALTFPVPVPIVVLLAASGVLVYAFHRVRKVVVLRQQDRPAGKPPVPPADPPAKPAPLTDNELAIVRLLTDADGMWLTVHEIAQRVRLRNYVTDQAIDRLVARGFLAHSVGGAGRVYRLSATGRDFAIAQGFANTTPRGNIR